MAFHIWPWLEGIVKLNRYRESREPSKPVVELPLLCCASVVGWRSGLSAMVILARNAQAVLHTRCCISSCFSSPEYGLSIESCRWVSSVQHTIHATALRRQ